MPVTLKLSRPEPAEEFTRADLEFRGVDHSGPSFEARVFFDNAKAEDSTECEEATGYAGSFHVFGHGGCFGELGHCDVKDAPRGVYDHRPPHQLTPQFKTVIVTAALRRVAQARARKDFTITIVAVVSNGARSAKAADDPLQFESVSLITYQDPSAAGIPLPQQIGAPPSVGQAAP
jgi:tyrosinase